MISIHAQSTDRPLEKPVPFSRSCADVLLPAHRLWHLPVRARIMTLTCVLFSLVPTAPHVSTVACVCCDVSDLDICCALTGRVSKAGVHLDDERLPRVILDGRQVASIVACPTSPFGRQERARRISEGLDAFFPVLGYVCGLLSEASVPLIVGFENVDISMDDLKAFSAAFGSTASAPMFHMHGHTPEASAVVAAAAAAAATEGRLAATKTAVAAKEEEEEEEEEEEDGGESGSAAIGDRGPVRSLALPRIQITEQHLLDAWDTLNGGALARPASGDRSVVGGGAEAAVEVQLVALGNPHLSSTECAELARLCGWSDDTNHGNDHGNDGGNDGGIGGGGRGGGGAVRVKDRKREDQEDGVAFKRKGGVAVVATLGRAVFREAERAGHVAAMSAFGVQWINDTCWCMLKEPVVPRAAAALVTNSAKYAHYAPGLLLSPPLPSSSPPPPSCGRERAAAIPAPRAPGSAMYEGNGPGAHGSSGRAALPAAAAQKSRRSVHFTSMGGCMEAARTGRLPPPPPWVVALGRGARAFLRAVRK